MLLRPSKRLAAITLACCLAPLATDLHGQVRSKRPDRGTYQSPVIGSSQMDLGDETPARRVASNRRPLPVGNSTSNNDLIGVSLTDTRGRTIEVPGQHAAANEPLQVVDPQEVRLVAPNRSVQRASISSPANGSAMVQQASHRQAATKQVDWDESHAIVHEHGEEVWQEGPVHPHDSSCSGCAECDSYGCDSYGCDSMGYNGPSLLHQLSNSLICTSPDRWFGKTELLMMWRKGDHLPPLLTTGPGADATTDGVLGQAGTVLLVGGNGAELKDLSIGGRYTLGTWLDNCQQRSLVLRGWLAGEESFSFNASQANFPVLTRPFFNVTNNQVPAQDTQLIAFPNRADGSISINAESDVYGADIQVRQPWLRQCGAAIDLFYGYQYMALKEDLSISNNSTSLDAAFAPVGSTIAVTDSFEADNQFHGGQLGISSRYRERCWSFDGTLKVAFGNLNRRAKLAGSTVTTNGGATAFDPNGLLVRSTNAGTTEDDTFGWVPELDASLGWHRFPRLDVTVGYHIIAMTDALQVSGAIDPALASNLASPLAGQQRPSTSLTYGTFYVQGIHFGLQYGY